MLLFDTLKVMCYVSPFLVFYTKAMTCSQRSLKVHDFKYFKKLFSPLSLYHFDKELAKKFLFFLS